MDYKNKPCRTGAWLLNTTTEKGIPFYTATPERYLDIAAGGTYLFYHPFPPQIYDGNDILAIDVPPYRGAWHQI